MYRLSRTRTAPAAMATAGPFDRVFWRRRRGVVLVGAASRAYQARAARRDRGALNLPDRPRTGRKSGMIRASPLCRDGEEHSAWSGQRRRCDRMPRHLALALLLALPLFVACGSAQSWTIEGHLVAGDTDVWLIDTTPVAIGAAKITGDPPVAGARVRATGRRDSGGLPQADSIVVGPRDAAALTSQLPANTVRGRVERGDATTGLWTVAGTLVRVPPGTAGAMQLARGRTVTAQGYSLPNGELLAASIVVDAVSTPTPAPAPPARTVPPSVPNTPTPAEPKRKPGKKEHDSDSKPGAAGNDD